MLRKLKRDRRGSAIAMMTVGLIPAIAALGGAIDAGRMYIVKSQLQAGVDAAALAGARSFAVTDGSPSSRTQQVAAYFDGNFSQSPAYMGTTNITVSPRFEVLNGINVTTVVARATVRMTFMRIFGFSSKELVATAKAELQPRPLEVMMVLDNTGSMKDALSGGKTRIMALKEAAKSFIDIVHQGAATRRDLAVGIIPYDVTVNVGHLLQAKRASAIQSIDGFTSGRAAGWGAWPTNRYAWKGCVMADSTVKDVSADRLVSEANAWDLTRALPGYEAPAVEPFFVPPMYVPDIARGSTNDTVANRANRTSAFYNNAQVEPGNNLYRLNSSTEGDSGADYLANTPLYRSFLYDYYIGLNNGSGTASDDVIRATDGSYYNPTSGTRTTNNWKVEWRSFPPSNRDGWRAPETATVNKDGGITGHNNGNNYKTLMPSPNWQCPEEALPVAYGRQKSEYNSYIDNKNGAIYPANGTIHHSGLLWGYRLLVRSDVFSRTNPTNEQPRRALVFMTDGLNEIGETQNGYTDRTFSWYGRWSDGRISANPANGEQQMLRRFSKVCANMQRETNPPEVYIIALVANSNEVNTAFNNCAPNRVYRTSNTDELKRAFQTVASELVDLHLIQ
ncbi:TadE/TadG family type IV pilus assembly protein [Sphingomonas sp. S2-65]|uniref:TadE/TadG family type IV pilus assembly protein n=1 Tax=Sphingomonas sp. S2-65 TaxID=2903960 RepID=UPI001F404989|nr:TadE/TadG family type IV pilus assembly protein [Sphingomonas sp. S2-65]UYY58924.1 pilus assembly protein [Sphingomonas sp. S2-65]